MNIKKTREAGMNARRLSAALVTCLALLAAEAGPDRQPLTCSFNAMINYRYVDLWMDVPLSCPEITLDGPASVRIELRMENVPLGVEFGALLAPLDNGCPPRQVKAAPDDSTCTPVDFAPLAPQPLTREITLPLLQANGKRWKLFLAIKAPLNTYALFGALEITLSPIKHQDPRP